MCTVYTVCFNCSSSNRLGAIIEATGASTYHGFLPTLVRDCVNGIITAGEGGREGGGEGGRKEQ